jgi:UDP-N-acetyl-D-galactosamine dehydrogenase
LERIAIIGLGYVGLPVALAFARQFEDVVGFDIHASKVAQLQAGIDVTGEVDPSELKATRLRVTADPADLVDRTVFIVAVPTPVDVQKRPDLTPLIRASETVGRVLRPGALVVYESTVYPGVTDEVCAPVLERVSGLRRGVDFKLGYSPERINPGDKIHTLERIVKVVSGEDAETLDRVAALYSAIVPAGVHRAASIAVAEAAKVIENTQRDVNIALVNELAMIFDRLGIRTRDVLEAAGTKWNFLPFTPGLVGGHCIGVDPYYLTTKAQELGYHPEVILAGRRINDGMGAFVARKLVKMLSLSDRPVRGARVAVLGLTFKEDVPDLRNSKVPDIVAELREFGIEPMIHDPMVQADEVHEEYGLHLTPVDDLRDLDAVILAVAHRVFLDEGPVRLADRLKDGMGCLLDVKAIFDPAQVPANVQYWSL